MRMILRMDSKRRLSLPAAFVPWMPGDYVDVTYVKSDDAFVARLVEGKDNWPKVLRKAQSIAADSAKGSRKKSKKNK